LPKKKLLFFADIKKFTNVIEHENNFGKIHPLKSQWASKFFNNHDPICLELGCGKGDYTIALAAKYPKTNFIGIDIKGDRLHRGAKKALDLNLKNVAFLRVQIQDLMCYFDTDEVSEIWITFPDPQPRKSKTDKRLTSEEFMEKYRLICKKNSLIHLKTDNSALFSFTLETWKSLNLKINYNTSDLYSESFSNNDITEIKTDYEKKYLLAGLKIHYLQAQII
jgi:tRNA (guanine-N7-)-methyltransferase